MKTSYTKITWKWKAQARTHVHTVAQVYTRTHIFSNKPAYLMDKSKTTDS